MARKAQALAQNNQNFQNFTQYPSNDLNQWTVDPLSLSIVNDEITRESLTPQDNKINKRQKQKKKPKELVPSIHDLTSQLKSRDTKGTFRSTKSSIPYSPKLKELILRQHRISNGNVDLNRTRNPF